MIPRGGALPGPPPASAGVIHPHTEVQMPSDQLSPDQRPEFVEFIKQVEGTKNRKGDQFFPYEDPAGLWTIGYGHLIGDGSSPGKYANGIPSEEVEAMLRKDIRTAYEDASRWIGNDEWDSLPPDFQQMATDIVFNLGATKARKFKNFRQAILERNRKAAVQEADRSYLDRAGVRKPLTERNKQFRRFFGSEPTTIK